MDLEESSTPSQSQPGTGKPYPSHFGGQLYLVSGVAVPNDELSILGGADQQPGGPVSGKADSSGCGRQRTPNPPCLEKLFRGIHPNLLSTTLDPWSSRFSPPDLRVPPYPVPSSSPLYKITPEPRDTKAEATHTP